MGRKARRNAQQQNIQAVKAEPRAFAFYLAPDGSARAIHAKTTAVDGNWLPGHSSRTGELRDGDQGYARAVSASDTSYRCIEVLSQKVSEIMWKYGKVVRRGTKDVVKNHALITGINRTYKAYQQDLFEAWARSLYTFGETYTELVNAYPYGVQTIAQPYCLRPLNALAIEPVIDRGRIQSYQYQWEDGTANFSPNSISFDKLPNPEDDYRGLSPMKSALAAINIDMYIQTTAKAFFRNSARPGIILTPKSAVTPNDWDQMTAMLAEEATGAKNAYRPLMPNIPMDANVLPVQSLEDQALLATAQAKRITTAFGVPLPLVTFDDMPYQLSSGQMKGFYELTLIPRCERIARVVNAEMLPFFDDSEDVEYILDADALRATLEDATQKTTIIANRLNGGWITYNEARQQDGLSPVEGGDVYVTTSALAYPQATPTNEILTFTTVPTVEIEKPQPPQLQDTNTETVINMPVDSARAVNTDTAEDELRKWMRSALKNGRNKALKFATYQVTEPHAELIRGELDILGNSPAQDAIKAVFARAIDRVTGKAIRVVRLDFEREFEDMLTLARNEDMKARQFRIILGGMIRRYVTRAYLDGLKDGGVENAEIEEDDTANINLLLADQNGFIENLTNTLFRGDGVSDAQADMKPALWFNQSIFPAYNAGLRSADANGLYEFGGEDGEESCTTCQTLKGQRHRLRLWAKYNLIPRSGSDLFECGNWQCEHRLIKVSGKARGNWLGRTVKADDSEHDHVHGDS